MKFFDYFEMSLENLLKRKMRTVLTAIAVAIGMFFVMIFFSIGTGAEKFVLNSLNEFNNINMITVYNQAYQSNEELSEKLAQADNSEKSTSDLYEHKMITDDVIKDLSTNNKVDDIILKYTDEVSEVLCGDKLVKEQPIVSYNGNKFYLNNELSSLQEQANNSKLLDNNINYLLTGEMITNKSTSSVMITETFAKTTLGFESVEESIGKEIILKNINHTIEGAQTKEIKATIVGIVDGRFYQPAMIVSKDIMKDVKNFNDNSDKTLEERGIDSIELSVKEIGDVVTVSQHIKNDLGYAYDSVQNIANTIEKVFALFKKVALFISAFVGVIACLMVVNTMIMSVKERTQAIGLMKATGASKADVKYLFIIESFTIGLIGGVIAVLVSLIGINIAKNIFSYFLLTYLDVTDKTLSILSQSFVLNPIVMVVTLIVGIIVTVLAGLSSAIKASNLDPIEAIKHS